MDDVGGFVAAYNWTTGQWTQDQVIADYDAHNGSSDWWRGWMAGLKKHYYIPFEHEKRS